MRDSWFYLHKLAYWKHVPTPLIGQPCLLFSGCLCESIIFPPVLLVPECHKKEQLPFWGGEKLTAALWDECPLLRLMCIQVMSRKKTTFHTHTLKLTHAHKWVVTLGSEVMLKLSLRNSKMQYPLIAKQMSLSYMLKPRLLKSIWLYRPNNTTSWMSSFTHNALSCLWGTEWHLTTSISLAPCLPLPLMIPPGERSKVQHRQDVKD